jgi:hypothetical protein
MTTTFRPALAGLLMLAAAQNASAQTVYSPYNVNPYSRSSLSPYINYSRNVGGDYDFRNPLVRPAMIVPDFLAAYDAIRATAGRPDYSLPPSSFEDWFKQRENETRFSPSGQPIGFQIYGPYYDLPNHNSYVPTAPNRGRIYR